MLLATRGGVGARWPDKALSSASTLREGNPFQAWLCLFGEKKNYLAAPADSKTSQTEKFLLMCKCTQGSSMKERGDISTIDEILEKPWGPHQEAV